MWLTFRSTRMISASNLCRSDSRGPIGTGMATKSLVSSGGSCLQGPILEVPLWGGMPCQLQETLANREQTASAIQHQQDMVYVYTMTLCSLHACIPFEIISAYMDALALALRCWTSGAGHGAGW